ncbi:MAG: YdiU family protein [Rubrivivax sp.]|nr:MAG: YdiU family protein [Rubrivivax sp.]
MHRFGFDNTFARELPGASVAWKPASAPEPRLLFANHELAAELGLPPEALTGSDAAALFAGNLLPNDAQPVAQAYAGHQFGGFSPQLGDGRALLLGEVIARNGQRRDIAFKGSGRTPFSRGGDGKAAVGPMLREVLIGEAMHALGIPTTRALAVAATGDQVYRDTPLPGAVLTRVAASHLRVGTFQFFASRGDLDTLRRVADYTIARHDPQLADAPDKYLGLLRAVAGRQAALIAQWMNVGFIHGVMNTDNMALSGETIDYGPCAFMEAYDPAAVFSSIDHAGRYAYGNQPGIARWNLARFAETLLPLMADEDDEPAVAQAVAAATAVINEEFPAAMDAALLAGQRRKLGIQGATPADDVADRALASDWLALLHAQSVDFTLAWRHLAGAAEGRPEPLRDLFFDRAALDAWLDRWLERLNRHGVGSAVQMRLANPAVIPRNHLVEEALTAATEGDLAPFETLLAALRSPWEESALTTRYAAPAPTAVTASYRTFCGT